MKTQNVRVVVASEFAAVAAGAPNPDDLHAPSGVLTGRSPELRKVALLWWAEKAFQRGQDGEEVTDVSPPKGPGVIETFRWARALLARAYEAEGSNRPAATCEMENDTVILQWHGTWTGDRGIEVRVQPRSATRCTWQSGTGRESRFLNVFKTFGDLELLEVTETSVCFRCLGIGCGCRVQHPGQFAEFDARIASSLSVDQGEGPGIPTARIHRW